MSSDCGVMNTQGLSRCPSRRKPIGKHQFTITGSSRYKSCQSLGEIKGVMKNYPDWVCNDCGKKASKKQFLVSTWHKGMCGVCGKVKMVTEPRDFYYPNFNNIPIVR